MLSEESRGTLADSGPWGMCFLSLSLPPGAGQSPCGGSVLAAVVPPSGVPSRRDLYSSRERQSVFSSEPGFLQKREELKSVQLLPPSPLFSWGYFLRPSVSQWGAERSGWGALVGWQRRLRGLGFAVGCGVPSTPSGSVRTASSLVSHLSLLSASL